MKKIHLVIIVVIAFAGAMVLSVYGNSSSYASLKEANGDLGGNYHIVGQWVKDKGLNYNPKVDPNFFSFHFRDSLGHEAKVVMFKEKPSDFERAEKLVIKGFATDTAFVANEILMKCPSKYTAEEPKVLTLNN